jgi:hypothetical protein
MDNKIKFSKIIDSKIAIYETNNLFIYRIQYTYIDVVL